MLEVHDCVRSSMAPTMKTREEEEVGIARGAQGRYSARGP